MLIRVCTAKIHRATVTEAKLHYVGSITIDGALLDASGIKEFQMVNVNSIKNGTFWQTYVMRGENGSGVICLNGPPAHHFKPGHKVIILAEAYIKPSEANDLQLTIVLVEDKKNKQFRTELKRVTSNKNH